MTSAEARAEARQGHRVRRSGWTDRWITYDRSLYFLQPVNPTTFADGPRRVVQASDWGATEFSATDWTLAPIPGSPEEEDQFPLTLPNLVLWLTPPTPGSLNQLDYIGPTLYQPDADLQPVSDGIGLTFDGNDYMRTVNNLNVFVGETISVFVVASRTDLGAADRAFLDLATASSIRTIGTGPKLKITYLGSPSQVSTTADIPELHSIAVIGIDSLGALAVRVNGVSYGLGAVTSNVAEYVSLLSHPSEFAIGSLADGVTAPHVGIIRELLYYTPALSAENYLLLEQWLMAKHGLTPPT